MVDEREPAPAGCALPGQRPTLCKKAAQLELASCLPPRFLFEFLTDFLNDDALFPRKLKSFSSSKPCLGHSVHQDGSRKANDSGHQGARITDLRCKRMQGAWGERGRARHRP